MAPPRTREHAKSGQHAIFGSTGQPLSDAVGSLLAAAEIIQRTIPEPRQLLEAVPEAFAPEGPDDESATECEEEDPELNISQKPLARRRSAEASLESLEAETQLYEF